MRYDSTCSQHCRRQTASVCDPGHGVRYSRVLRVGICLLGSLFVGACSLTSRLAGPGSTDTPAPTPSRTPVPTFTYTPTMQPTPTHTPIPTASAGPTAALSAPTSTPPPVATDIPTVAPVPTHTTPPTAAPTPTEAPTPTVTPTPEPIILYVLASTQREFNCDYTYIYGTVQNANAQGIPGVTVRALGIHETTGLDFTTQTDAEGRYEIFRIPLAELQVGQWAVMLMSTGNEVSERFHWASTPVCQSSDLGHSQVLRVDWKLIE